jgi:hypothetical protein
VGVRRRTSVSGGRGGFGGVLAGAAVHCGHVARVLACWRGQGTGDAVDQQWQQVAQMPTRCLRKSPQEVKV